MSYSIFKQSLSALIFTTLCLYCCACNKSLNNGIDNTLISNGDTTLLFVGNSLTYANDLPQLVANIDRTKDLSYYGSDMFHPSLQGSQVAAEVIYKAIFNP